MIVEGAGGGVVEGKLLGTKTGAAAERGVKDFALGLSLESLEPESESEELIGVPVVEVMPVGVEGVVGVEELEGVVVVDDSPDFVGVVLE
jgi:hypothetical protein